MTLACLARGRPLRRQEWHLVVVVLVASHAAILKADDAPRHGASQSRQPSELPTAPLVMGYGRYGLSLPDPATSATSYSLTALSQGWARGAAFGLLAQPNGAKTGPCTDTPQAWAKLRGRFATCAAPLALRAHRQPEPRRLSRLGPGLHRPATARAATTAATARSATAKSATRSRDQVQRPSAT